MNKDGSRRGIREIPCLSDIGSPLQGQFYPYRTLTLKFTASFLGG